MVDNQRRRLLELTGTALATGLAGCGQNSNQQTPTEEENTDESGSDGATSEYEARIEFLEQNNLKTVPIVNEGNFEDVASVEVEVEDRNGLENVRLSYNDQHRDDPLTLYDKARGDFEDGEMAVISEEFPQRFLAPETCEFQVEVTDVQGNTEILSESIDPEGSKGYRADRIRTDTGNIGNYQTERNWDDLVTNTEEIQEDHENWNEQQQYTPLVNQIMSGEDFESGGELYPNWEGEDDGFFDQDAVKNEDNFEQIIRWYLPTILDHDNENYGNAPSSRNYRFAATLETLLNEHHPNAEAQATHVKSLPAHGIFGVQDTNNEQFYLVDTTSSAQYERAVGKIGNFITSEFDPSQDLSRQNLWDPFHQFQPGAQGMHYESKSKRSMGALMTFAATNDMGDNFDQFFITDEWMNEAYEVLRNGGSIDPIVEPIEELQYNAPQLEENNNIGIYGSLDDTRIAVSSGEEVYEAVMYDETTKPGIEDIETMLEAV